MKVTKTQDVSHKQHIGDYKQINNVLFLFLFLFFSLPFLKGCAAPVLVASGAGGYVATNKEASNKSTNWLGELSMKLQCITKKDEIVLHSYKITPKEVRRGSDITVTIVYGIACAPPAGVEVKEQVTLYFEGKEIAILDDATTNRENGKWESKLTFTMPNQVKTGKYIVKQRISTGSKEINIQEEFQVI